MGKKEKLLRKLVNSPNSFTFEDAEALFRCLSFQRSDKGRTSGSRVEFVSAKFGNYQLHRPHPQKELPAYAVRQLKNWLVRKGQL